ncbi:hypothetical protein GTA09_20015 [Rhodococcus hoagii]|nr:hypothetical protein [Prescottella equi]
MDRAAAKVDGRPNRSKRSRLGSGALGHPKEGLAAIRTWAADNGYHVSTRGRIAGK